MIKNLSSEVALQNLNKKVKELLNSFFVPHPRPDFYREKFFLLNGEWDLEYDTQDIGERDLWYEESSFTKKIIIPYCLESKASQVEDKSLPKVIWYKKIFNLPVNFSLKNNIFLNFGAVDFLAKVWLNGNFLGSHRGGYSPFKFNIAKHLKEKENILVVKVKDSLSPQQPRGKQMFLFKKPLLVFYTPVTGIWQDVYLEETAKTFIESVKIYVDGNNKKIGFKIFIQGEKKEYQINIKLLNNNNQKTLIKKFPLSLISPLKKQMFYCEFSLPKNFNLNNWSPQTPNLYFTEITINENKKIIDKVKTYFGFRKIEIKDKNIFLNGEKFYHQFLLVQGYYPNGFYTPTEEQIIKDLLLIKEMGFNGLRMHQKIEVPKFYYWCDVLGLAVWEEMPSFYWYSNKSKKYFLQEWSEVRNRDFNHPSIIVLVPFNESWGIPNIFISQEARDFVTFVYEQTKKENPQCLVIDNSGFHHLVTDILDIHHYLHSLKDMEKFYNFLTKDINLKFNLKSLAGAITTNIFQAPYIPKSKYNGVPVMISEYGGFGYKFYPFKDATTSEESFKKATLLIAKYSNLVGYAYTQFYDTRQEKNGLLNFSRKPKVNLKIIKKINEEAKILWSN